MEQVANQSRSMHRVVDQSQPKEEVIGQGAFSVTKDTKSSILVNMSIGL